MEPDFCYKVPLAMRLDPGVLTRSSALPRVYVSLMLLDAAGTNVGIWGW